MSAKELQYIESLFASDSKSGKDSANRANDRASNTAAEEEHREMFTDAELLSKLHKSKERFAPPARAYDPFDNMWTAGKFPDNRKLPKQTAATDGGDALFSKHRNFSGMPESISAATVSDSSASSNAAGNEKSTENSNNSEANRIPQTNLLYKKKYSYGSNNANSSNPNNNNSNGNATRKTLSTGNCGSNANSAKKPPIYYYRSCTFG